MPGFTTHYILGMKAYNNMPSGQLKFVIAKYRWLYQLGLQGPDMFFYNLPILRHRDYRNVGSYMHEHHVNQFFRCCLENISKIESKQQRERYGLFLRLSWPLYRRLHLPSFCLRTDWPMMSATLLPTTTVSTRFWKMTLIALLLYKYKHKLPSQFNSGGHHLSERI